MTLIDAETATPDAAKDWRGSSGQGDVLPAEAVAVNPAPTVTKALTGADVSVAKSVERVRHGGLHACIKRIAEGELSCAKLSGRGTPDAVHPGEDGVLSDSHPTEAL